MSGAEQSHGGATAAGADVDDVRPAETRVTVYAFVRVNRDNPQALEQYMAITGPLLEAAGARIVRTFELAEDIVGNRMPETVYVVDYPDRVAVRRVFDSAEYARAIPYRDRAFSAYAIRIAS